MTYLLCRVGLGVVTFTLLYCWMTPVPMDSKFRVMLVGGACCNTTCDAPLNMACAGLPPCNANWKRITPQKGVGLMHIVKRPNSGCPSECNPMLDDMKGGNGCTDLNEPPDDGI